MKKLTRKAWILIFVVLLALLLVGGYFLIDDNVEEESSKQAEYDVTVVVENQEILSTYVDAISDSVQTSQYSACQLKVEKGTKVAGYVISKDQVFSKYIQLTGPTGKDILSNKSKQKITHYAYSMLLTGDIIEKTNKETKDKTYEITNASITYNRIPLVLLSNENSVCITNQNKTKEKIVKLNDFQEALRSVEKRQSMISW
jgi:hypothetical protein